MEHTKHLFRALILLGFAGILSVIGRHFLVPDSFGVNGYYRNDSLHEHMAKSLVHGSPTSCDACHADRSQALAEGKHATVSCQVCHAPLLGHARDGEKTGDMRTNLSHKLCEYCHLDLVARPDSIPQVDARAHLVAMEMITQEDPIEEGTCSTCHDVHSPDL